MSGDVGDANGWPALPYPEWAETCSALHLYAQIVGKYRLARTPWLNHSWHATLYVNARGLTTSLVPDDPGGVEITLDLLQHAVVGSSTNGRADRFDLAPMSVADFHARFVDLLGAIGATPEFHGRPNEVRDPVPFENDIAPRPYDAEAATRFFRASVAVDRVFKRFRTAFLGKASPVHLFWGSFDLAVTRFSGRRRRCMPAVFRRFPTTSPARRTATRSRRPASGPAETAWTSPPSTRTRPPPRPASPAHP